MKYIIIPILLFSMSLLLIPMVGIIGGLFLSVLK